MKILKLSMIAIAVTAIVGCNKDVVQKPNQMPPKLVTTITIKEEPVKIQSELKGRLSAIEEAEVRPQITGIIKEVKVKKCPWLWKKIIMNIEKKETNSCQCLYIANSKVHYYQGRRKKE